MNAKNINRIKEQVYCMITNYEFLQKKIKYFSWMVIMPFKKQFLKDPVLVYFLYVYRWGVFFCFGFFPLFFKEEQACVYMYLCVVYRHYKNTMEVLNTSKKGLCVYHDSQVVVGAVVVDVYNEQKSTRVHKWSWVQNMFCVKCSK